MPKKGKQLKLQDIRKDESGTYTYQGEMYKFRGDFGAHIKKGWIFTCIIALAAVGGGLLPATGMMDTWYVIIPYAATVGAAGFIVYRMVHWTSGKGELRSYNYERTARNFGVNIYILLVTSVITLVSETVHLFINGLGEYGKGAIILLICMTIAFLGGLALLKHIKSAEWDVRQP